MECGEGSGGSGESHFYRSPQEAQLRIVPSPSSTLKTSSYRKTLC